MTDELKPRKGVDASGNAVDLSEFEESYYKPGQVEDILQAYDQSLAGIEEGQVVGGKILRITDKEVLLTSILSRRVLYPFLSSRMFRILNPATI